MEYPKINSLWKRQEYVKGLPKGTHGPLIVGDYSEPEFGAVKQWRVDEKIDGTNIRIELSRSEQKVEILIGGRTENAQIPPHLLKYLQGQFGKDEGFERMLQVFPDSSRVMLFGEGYGPKIQGCGSNYRKDASFILFDVWIGGWWLKREDVIEIAQKLEVDVVPHIGFMTEYEIVEFVKSKPLSQNSIVPQMMEGVVCRSEPLMLFRNGKPLMWKLKCKEFV